MTQPSGFANQSLGDQLFDDSFNKDSLLSDIIELVLLIAGILSNLILVAIVFKKKKTESFRSHKPLRYLLIVILICDIAYLISELNVKIFKFGTWPDLTSFNYFCQVHSYLYYFFAVLIEFSMLSANYIVACLIHLPKQNTKSSIDVYNDFIINENDSTNLRRGNFKSRSIRRLRSLFVRSNSEPVEKMMPRPVSDDNLEQNLRGKGRHVNNLKRASLGANSKMTSGACVAKNVNIETTIQATHRHDGVTNENETNRFMRNGHDGTQSSLNNRISLLNEINRRERINQYRANANSLVYPLKIEEDDTYFSLALKEKFFIILSIFVCMYFLSFFLWIQGVENLDNGLGHKYEIKLHSRMNPKGFMASKGHLASVFSNKTDFDKQFNDLFAVSMPSFAPLSTVSSTPAVPNSFSPFSSASSSSAADKDKSMARISFSKASFQVCKTHKFATNFLRYFLLFLSLLRLVTLCINLVMSVCFCVRFKADLIQTLFSSFKKRDDTFYSKSKLINFKSFKFTLITDCEQPSPEDNGQACLNGGGGGGGKRNLARKSFQTNPSDSSRQISHMDMECTTTNELDSNGNSHSEVVSHAARANVYKRFKRDRNHRLVSHNQHKMYYSHLHFVRHHITAIAFYSILISFGVINEINNIYLNRGAPSLSTDFPPPSPYGSSNSDLDNIYSNVNSGGISLDFIRARMNTTLAPPPTTTTVAETDGPTTSSANSAARLTLKSKSIIEKFIDMESDSKEAFNFQTLINLTTILAHSTKLLIYLVFSAHIKCFVKLNRPRAGNQIRDDV